MSNSIITPSTELDAVNDMLLTIGESPVNKIGSGLEESAIAHRILHRVSRQVQSRGWFFNTEGRLIKRTPEGEAILPRNVLKVDVMGDKGRFIQRGLKLYDRMLGTYRIDEDMPAQIVVGLDFDELPEVARTYIYIRAARIFQAQTVGSQVLNAYALQEEMDALVLLEQEETEAGDYNLFRNPEVRSLLDRSAGSAAHVGSLTYAALRLEV